MNRFELTLLKSESAGRETKARSGNHLQGVRRCQSMAPQAAFLCTRIYVDQRLQAAAICSADG